jgi:hypothetical protein
LSSKSATRQPPTSRGPPLSPHYFALNPIIDKFSFTLVCHLGSSGQHKTGRHIIQYTIQPEQMQNIYWTQQKRICEEINIYSSMRLACDMCCHLSWGGIRTSIISRLTMRPGLVGTIQFLYVVPESRLVN